MSAHFRSQNHVGACVTACLSQQRHVDACVSACVRLCVRWCLEAWARRYPQLPPENNSGRTCVRSFRQKNNSGRTCVRKHTCLTYLCAEGSVMRCLKPFLKKLAGCMPVARKLAEGIPVAGKLACLRPSDLHPCASVSLVELRGAGNVLNCWGFVSPSSCPSKFVLSHRGCATMNCPNLQEHLNSNLIPTNPSKYNINSLQTPKCALGG